MRALTAARYALSTFAVVLNVRSKTPAQIVSDFLDGKLIKRGIVGDD